MRRAVVVSLLAVGLLSGASAPAMHPAGLFTKTDRVVTMDDGVGIATTTYIPVEHAPHTGVFPAVMLFHGLGGNRQSLDPIATRFAQAGYVAFTFDFRGHGQSGGLFSGLGARDVADVNSLRDRWLPELAPIRRDRVGAWGISLGGGAVLHPSVANGFAAAAVVETWTDLYGALVPNGLPKTGALFQFLNAIPRERQAPELLAIRDAIARNDRTALARFGELRSSASSLILYPPTLVFQGRRDFAFGLEQGLTMYQRLRTRSLYIGPFGHAPSRFPGPDFDVVMDRSLQWFNSYLAGFPAPPDMPRVELAPDPFVTGSRTVGFSDLPPTRTLRYVLRGRATIGSAGKVVRRAGRLPTRQETFGTPVVRVSASSRTGWSHLVAVLVARTPQGREIVVSEGGAPTRLGARSRPVTIRLISQVTLIPAGSRLELTLAGTSTAQNPGNLLYLVPVPQRARVTLGTVELRLPVLRRPISR